MRMQHLVTSQIRPFSALLTKLNFLISLDAKHPSPVLDFSMNVLVPRRLISRLVFKVIKGSLAAEIPAARYVNYTVRVTTPLSWKLT